MQTAAKLAALKQARHQMGSRLCAVSCLGSPDGRSRKYLQNEEVVEYALTRSKLFELPCVRRTIEHGVGPPLFLEKQG